MIPKDILDLQLVPASKPFPVGPYSHFFRKMNESGLRVRGLTYDPKSSLPNDFGIREVQKASAFLLRNEALIKDPNPVIDAVRKRMADGVPLVVFADLNLQESQNRFLADYGIELTSLGLYAYPGDQQALHPSDIEVSRSTVPSAFRDPRLFSGVGALRLSDTMALRLRGGRVQSLFAIPDGYAFCVDKRSDLMADWPAPEFACIANYLNSGTARENITVLSTSLFGDPSRDLRGRDHLGITGGDNSKFAQNFIDALASSGAESVPRVSVPAHSLLERIERMYFDITKAVLGREGGDWWSSVPESVKGKCSEARARNERSALPEWSYLYLVQFEKIWRVNWDSFGLHFSAIGCGSGKNKALAYFNRLNEIRNKVMHPVKLYSIGEALSGADYDFLVDCDKVATQLYRCVVDLRAV